MKNLITLNYQNMIIHASREAWFNATEIAALFGKRPIDWLRLPETERYITALCKHEADKSGKSEVRKSHFVRSLASSILNEQGFNPDAIERQLAHVEENKIRAAYNRAEYLAERTEMMQWYSDYLRERYEAAQIG